MARQIKLSALDETLSTLDYPLAREDAAAGLDDVVVQLADGEVALNEVVETAPEERYDSAEELNATIMANLPTEAVGEPGQSEGEG